MPTPCTSRALTGSSRLLATLLGVATFVGLGLRVAHAQQDRTPSQPSVIPSLADLEANNLQVLWQLNLALPEDSTIARISRLDENLYMLDSDGILRCVHADVGVSRWTFELAPPTQAFWPPAHNPDREILRRRLTNLNQRLDAISELSEMSVGGAQRSANFPEKVDNYVNTYLTEQTDRTQKLTIEAMMRADRRAIEAELSNVRSQLNQLTLNMSQFTEVVTVGTSGRAFTLDLATGSPRQVAEFGFGATSSPATSGPLFFVGGGLRFYAYDTSVRGAIWQVLSTGAVSSQPVYFGQRVYWVDNTGTVMASDAREKRNTWSLNLGGGVASNMELHPQGLLVGTTTHSLYLIDRVTGRVRSQLRTGGPIRRTASATADLCYVLSEGVGLHIATLPDLTLRHMLPDARQLVCELPGGQVLVRNRGGELARVRLSDGKVLSTLALAADTLVVANDLDARVYAVSPAGHVMCLVPATFPYLKKADVDRVPNLSTVYSPIREYTDFGRTSEQRQIDALLEEDFSPIEPPTRTDYLTSQIRSLPASGAINRGDVTEQ